MNIKDYVTKKNVRFSASPFNNVDAVLLSQIMYAKIETIINAGDIVPGPSGVPLKEFYRAEYFPEMFGDGITDRDNLELFTAVCASPRYRDIRVRHLETSLDKEIEKQFAAACFVIGDDTEFVAFRGTDGTLLGWKEDFNMAFMDEVPSQRAAVGYLNRHFGKNGSEGDKRIYVGGHSKGGNLAIYGSLMADEEVRRRLITVYSLEGPGFREEVNERLAGIAAKDNINIVKIVPKTSLIGMIMEDLNKARVVDAKGFGMMQHSTHTWQVEGDDFRYTEMSYGGDFNNRVLMHWMEQISDRDRKLFVDGVFESLFMSNIRSVNDIRTINTTKIRKLLDSLSSLDDESKRVIMNALASLGKTALRNIPPEEIIRALRTRS